MKRKEFGPLFSSDVVGGGGGGLGLKMRNHQFMMFLCLLFVSSIQCITPPSSNFNSHNGGLSKLNCHDLGFTDSLLCSSCTDFEEFVADPSLVEECKNCCAQEAKTEKVRHSLSLYFLFIY
ncbi:15 kDa selenoprotein [Cavenderia fasciculata]|uniref:15 kDa selenoprotein n=1 Tax=Cavenderia fasciculata TaxID=261658 RepID=F4Q8M9_CACFS|nr:15 kDa selenoprotein [Cavenderia fasciculata]EGG15048.1 15 kDa selenoprotein [Cavenderia fasciculata]|eukprot:XP_004351768.1 15 kDa selenoprotein [Cavenderia fasciculata]